MVAANKRPEHKISFSQLFYEIKQDFFSNNSLDSSSIMYFRSCTASRQTKFGGQAARGFKLAVYETKTRRVRYLQYYCFQISERSLQHKMLIARRAARRFEPPRPTLLSRLVVGAWRSKAVVATASPTFSASLTFSTTPSAATRTADVDDSSDSSPASSMRVSREAELASLARSLDAAGQTAIMFFDSLCPLCSFEIGHLRKLAAARRISWVDVGAKRVELAVGTSPASPIDLRMFGKTQDELLSAMHVYDVTSGQWHVGTDAVRELYGQLGLGWLWRWTKHPAVRSSVDAAYEWFAANRHKLVPRRSAK